MVVEFSTANKETLKEVSNHFISKNFLISSYEMEEKLDGNGEKVFYINMIVKAKNMNEEGVLLMLLHDFPEIKVHKIM